MAWLMREGKVLASAELVTDRLSRLRGFGGRDRMDGAVVLRPAWAAHTIGAPGPLDLVFCDAGMVVVEVVPEVRTSRLTLVRPRARTVIGVEAGFAARHSLVAGDQLELRG